jgi:hypothetical protein
MANIEKIVKKNKKLKTGEVLPNHRFKTPVFRLSYPHIDKPSDYDPENPKYGVTMLFDEGLVSLSAFKKLVKLVAKEKWGAKVPKKLSLPFRDGEEKEDTDGYGEGIIFSSARSSDAPGVCDLQFAPTEVKAGDYCRATVNVFAYDNKKKGVAFGLQNVQLICEGEAFGAERPDAEDDFDDLDIDDEDLEEEDEDNEDDDDFEI